MRLILNLEVRMVRAVKLLTPICLLSMTAALPAQTRRPLAIEDYYRVLTIASPQIAADGKTVRFSVTTRVEQDNSTKTETFTVPTDGSAPPAKVQTATTGRGGRGGGGTVRV